jgi:hypothetical protein
MSRIYSNSSSSSYAGLDTPAVLLDLGGGNCCRMAPYVKCGHCLSKCSPCCKGILQGMPAKFEYDLAGGNNCGACKGVPNAVQSCQGSGGLKCKYYQ